MPTTSIQHEPGPLVAPVQIIRVGNILDVSPACEHILGPALSYSHRQMRAGMDAVVLGAVDTYDRKLYRVYSNHLLVNQGALTRITQRLDAEQVPWQYSDQRHRTILRPDYDHLARCMPYLVFRVRQAEVLAHLIGYNSGIIVAPTAYGKTFIMLALTALFPTANIVMASPSTSLLNSTYKRILKITGDVGRVGGGHHTTARVTLSTYKSLMRAPLDKCDILLIDEVHGAAASEISETLSKIRNPVKIFGMTATPTGRADNAELVIECLVGPVIFEIPYDEVVSAGDISQIRVAMMSLKREDCGTQISGAYKMQVAKKRNAYWRNNVRNRLLVEATLHLPSAYGLIEPQTLILTKTLEHALRIQAMLPAFQVVYGSLSRDQRERLTTLGLLPDDYRPLTTKQRELLLDEFEAGTLRNVIATGCWGEGIDPVHLEVIVNASGEASKILTTQWGGRASRLTPGGHKKFGLLIDCQDEWDPWTLHRAYARRNTYKKHGWEITKIGKLSDAEKILEKQSG